MRLNTNGWDARPSLRSSAAIWRPTMIAAPRKTRWGRFNRSSPVEGSPACVFHIQVLQDFMTIDEIAHKLFDEIDHFKPMPRDWLHGFGLGGSHGT